MRMRACILAAAMGIAAAVGAFGAGEAERTRVDCLAFSTNDQSLFYANMLRRGPVRRYEIRSGRLTGEYATQASVNDIAISADGAYLVAATLEASSSRLQVWDLETGAIAASTDAGEPVLWTSFAGTREVAYGYGSKARVLSLVGGPAREADEWGDFPRVVNVLSVLQAVSPDRSHAISLDRTKADPLQVVSLPDGVLRWTVPTGGTVLGASFSPDSALLGIVDANGSRSDLRTPVLPEGGTVSVYKVASGVQLLHVRIPYPTGALAFSRSGEMIAVGSGTGAIALIRIGDRQVVGTVEVSPSDERVVDSIRRQDDGTLRAMLQSGVDPNMLESGVSPDPTMNAGTYSLLSLAASGPDTRLARTLLEAGADPNLPDPAELGPEVNLEGGTPLMRAVAYQRMEAMKELVAKGANPNYVGATGRTGLILAGKNAEAASILRRAGARDDVISTIRVPADSPGGGVVAGSADALLVAPKNGGLWLVPPGGGKSPRKVSGNVPTDIRAIEAGAGRAWVITGGDSPQLLTVDTRAASVAGRTALPHAVLGFAMDGQHGYFVEEGSLLAVRGVAESKTEGAVDLQPGDVIPSHVAVYGRLAALLGEQGVSLVDISDSRQPARLGSLPLRNGSARWAIFSPDGTRLLVGCGWSLVLTDCTDPQRPRLVQTLDAQGLPIDAAWRGGIVYVLSAGGTIFRYDTTHPAGLQALSPLFMERPSSSITIVGSQLYALGRDAPEVQVVDLSGARGAK